MERAGSGLRTTKDGLFSVTSQLEIQRFDVERNGSVRTLGKSKTNKLIGSSFDKINIGWNSTSSSSGMQCSRMIEKRSVYV